MTAVAQTAYPFMTRWGVQVHPALCLTLLGELGYLLFPEMRPGTPGENWLGTLMAMSILLGTVVCVGMAIYGAHRIFKSSEAPTPLSKMPVELAVVLTTLFIWVKF